MNENGGGRQKHDFQPASGGNNTGWSIPKIHLLLMTMAPQLLFDIVLQSGRRESTIQSDSEGDILV